MKNNKSIRSFIQNNLHFALCLYFIVYLLWFKLVEESVTTHFHIIHTALDDMIPFCEYFVIPYLLWFAYIAWGFLYFGCKEKEIFVKMCAFLFTGMTLFLVISTLYPNGHFLRPIYFSHHNICTKLCEYLYSIDTPTNLFPSIHVYNSLGVHLAVMKSQTFKNKPVAKIMSGILCFSIILSTMFIKQHSTFDVMTAILLAVVMYYFSFVRSYKHMAETKTAATKEYANAK